MRRIATLLILAFLCAAPLGCGGPANPPATGSAPPLWVTNPGASASPKPPTAAKPRAKGPFPGPRIDRVTREPAIRVRVRSNVDAIEIVGRGAIRVAGSTKPTDKSYRYATPARVAREGEAWVIRDARGQTVRWPLARLLVEDNGGGVLDLGETKYPRRLVLTPRTDKDQRETGRFDAVNHVPLETYLAGVIEKELYANWPPETFRAQAVAARSYALWEMTIARHRHYDLESTTASQAYIGNASNPRAVEAVAHTRGQCLAYAGRVVPAFYSSSAGGLGQDAVLAFPNRVEDIPPLRGRVHGGWDQESPRYRWGPVTRNQAQLARRIAAWGRDRHHPVGALRSISHVAVAARNGVGRPAAWAVTDTSGKRYVIACEGFRNACNHTVGGKLPVSKQQRLYSSHFVVSVGGGSVRFSEGRGYGHGVGMSQWGARTMAKAGHPYRAILEFYYPDAAVQKLY